MFLQFPDRWESNHLDLLVAVGTVVLVGKGKVSRDWEVAWILHQSNLSL